MEVQAHFDENLINPHHDTSTQGNSQPVSYDPKQNNEQPATNEDSALQNDTSPNQVMNDSNYINPSPQEPVSSINMSNNVDDDSQYASCQPAPMVEIKLFCGRVPKTMSEEDITHIFQEFGIVKEVIIIRDKESNNHKSSAFVRMASIAHADAAIQVLNGQKTLDSSMGPLQVKYANGEAAKHHLLDTTATEQGTHQAKVFVGSLPKSVSEEMIRELFSPYGLVDEVFIMMDKATGTGKGCAFVKFAFKEQALYAMRNLDGKKTMEGCNRPIEVRFAESKPQKTSTPFNQYNVSHMGISFNNMMHSPLPILNPTAPSLPNQNTPRSIGPWKEYWTPEGRPYYHNEQTQTTTWVKPHDFDQIMNNSLSTGTFGPKGANVFIFYVPNEWNQNDLVNSFGAFGNIISARIATDKQSGRNRGYAFVSYDSASSAASAIHHMNGYLAMTKRLKVTIKKGEESYVKPFLDQMAGSGSGMGGNEQMPHQSVFSMAEQSPQYAL